MDKISDILRNRGIQPTLQRLAVAQCVLKAETHPTAEEVLTMVKRQYPMISRATVYNTLNLFVSHGLLRTQVLREGSLVFDPKTDAHHHFIDEKTGKVYDVPWEAVRVSGQDELGEYEVREFQVVMRGRRRKRT